ncbi:MAG: bifunctional adenosylcobinamide kinase/adenosylcobinamide-phosphate guanylyltransferase [Pseudomonadota bacterium]
MNKSYLILGGAKSGKTAYALRLANAIVDEKSELNQKQKKIYIATAQAHDDEMQERIENHKKQRANQYWDTLESPVDIVVPIRDASQNAVILVDCLTLWLSNLMHHDKNLDEQTQALVSAIHTSRANTIFVSNEVGLGIVPNTKLGRVFRDAQGHLNQTLASCVDQVEFIAAGLPLTLKS